MPAPTAEVLELVDAADTHGGAAGAVSYRRALALLGAEPHGPVLREQLEHLLGSPEQRLAAYGTLRPGAANHALVAHLPGSWTAGWIRGVVRVQPNGYTGLTLEPDGPRVPVAVLASRSLPAHWPALDAFEGPGYRRRLVLVEDAAGDAIVAYAYVVAPPPRP